MNPAHCADVGDGGMVTYTQPVPNRGPQEDAGSSPVVGYREFEKDQIGVTFQELFFPHLLGAADITITDPYLRTFRQLRNLMEVLTLVLVSAPEAATISVKVRTSRDRSAEG
jgi:ATP-dependent Lon protease